MGYQIKQRAETITANTRLTDTKYCGWLALNIGTADVTVYGVTLAPGEGLSSQSIIQTTAADRWTEPIDITVQPGGAVRMLRTVATIDK